MKRFTLIIPALIIFFIAVNGYSDTTRVLFIGNSYTYANNLPLIFSNLSASGNKNTVTDISAPGGYSFENHYSNPETISKIKMGNWNFVLLQEQSQMPVIPYYLLTLHTLTQSCWTALLNHTDSRQSFLLHGAEKLAVSNASILTAVRFS